MSMPCPKCGNEVYREDNYECPCEDCTTPVGKPDDQMVLEPEDYEIIKALEKELTKAKAQIKALEKEDEAQTFRVKILKVNVHSLEEREKCECRNLQAQIDEVKKAGAFNEFREVMFKVHNLLGVSTDQTFKNIAEEMYTKIEAIQAQIEAVVRLMVGAKYDGEMRPAIEGVLEILTGETGKVGG